MRATRWCRAASSSWAPTPLRSPSPRPAGRPWPSVSPASDPGRRASAATASSRCARTPAPGPGRTACRRHLQDMAAQVQRAQFAQREPRLQSFQDLPVQMPARAPVLVAFVVKGKAGFLQRLEVPANGARRDREIPARSSIRSTGACVQGVQHLPLADDFLVSRHRLAAFLGGRNSRRRLRSGVPAACAAARRCVRRGAARPLPAWAWASRRRTAPRLGFLDVLFDGHADDHVLMPSEAAIDPEAVAFADQAMRFRAVAIHLYVTALARALGFRARLEEARDVEPGIEAHVTGADRPATGGSRPYPSPSSRRRRPGSPAACSGSAGTRRASASLPRAGPCGRPSSPRP